jgi:hypothetical protein
VGGRRVDGARGGQRSGAERASSACCSLRATCAGCVIQCGSCFVRVRTCVEPQGQHAQSNDPRNKGGGAEANAEGEQETAEEERRLPRAAPPRAHVRDARTHPRAARPRLSPAFALDRKPLMLRRSTSQHSQRENSLRMSSPQPIACKLNQDRLRLLPATIGCALAPPIRSPRHRHLFLQLIHPLPARSLRRRASPSRSSVFPSTHACHVVGWCFLRSSPPRPRLLPATSSLARLCSVRAALFPFVDAILPHLTHFLRLATPTIPPHTPRPPTTTHQPDTHAHARPHSPAHCASRARARKKSQPKRGNGGGGRQR